MKISQMLEMLLSLPKTNFFNFSQLRIKDAIHLPILVSHRTKLKSLKGRIVIDGPIKFGQVRFGLKGAGSGTAYFKPIVIENHGTIVFQDAIFFRGVPNMHCFQG